MSDNNLKILERLVCLCVSKLLQLIVVGVSVGMCYYVGRY